MFNIFSQGTEKVQFNFFKLSKGNDSWCSCFNLQLDLEADDIKYLKNNSTLISYPKPLYEDYSASQKYPVAIALTQFHILLAYIDTIKGVCLLNQEVVYEDNYNEAFGKLINVIKDIRTGKWEELCLVLSSTVQSLPDLIEDFSFMKIWSWHRILKFRRVILRHIACFWNIAGTIWDWFNRKWHNFQFSFGTPYKFLHFWDRRKVLDGVHLFWNIHTSQKICQFYFLL